jgi:hypothetical protein
MIYLGLMMYRGQLSLRVTADHYGYVVGSEAMTFVKQTIEACKKGSCFDGENLPPHKERGESCGGMDQHNL